MRFEQLTITACGQPAVITTYLLNNYDGTKTGRVRPLIVICPGGGYAFTSEREAEVVALKMTAMGLHAIVIHYSVAPATFPVALAQLAATVALARQNADSWYVEPNNISVMGFSAGGHLAGSLGVFWNSQILRNAVPKYSEDQVKPNRLVLCYPVISPYEYRHEGSFKNLLGDRYDDVALLRQMALDEQVSVDTPPTFLWHTSEDNVVPPQNSILFASALLRNRIPCELHLYPKGCHGLSLANSETAPLDRDDLIIGSCQNWVDMAARFLKTTL